VIPAGFHGLIGELKPATIRIRTACPTCGFAVTLEKAQPRAARVPLVCHECEESYWVQTPA
jgi:predicted RNA-binding Zn-ribbon protein involved in translation (DUF1610 family)